jgi:hypothetical protein
LSLPKYFSCMSDAKELELLWDEFQGDGYPLDKISESLLVYDINDFLRGILLIPSLIEPIILIDSINSCKSIKGTDLRKSNLKRVLNGIVKEQANLDQLGHRLSGGQQEYASYIQRSKNLLGKIPTSINEFQIASPIKQLFPFNNFTYP